MENRQQNLLFRTQKAVTRNTLIWKFLYLLAAGGIFLIDQVTKAWAIQKLRFGGDIGVISGFFNLSYAENTGIAFSFLNNGGDSGRWGLAGIALVAGVAVLYYFWKIPRDHDRLLGALALLLGGIAGNVTDRLRLGFVVDFLQFHYKDWYYPTFNVADMAVCTGAALLVLDVFMNRKKGEDEAPEAAKGQV